MTDAPLATTDADLERLIDTHLAGYCEPDGERRRELLAAVWADDGDLVDPPFAAAGPDAISGLADTLLAHYPGHRFERTTAIDAHHDTARYGWSLVGPDGAVAVGGLDVAMFEDGRLRRVVGFFGDLAARS